MEERHGEAMRSLINTVLIPLSGLVSSSEYLETDEPGVETHTGKRRNLEWPKQLPALLHGSQSAHPTPRLIFTLETFRQLDFYYREVEQEFQLMGLIDRVEEANVFLVTELVLNKHSAGMAHADIDQGSFPSLLDSLEEAGKDIRKLRFQAHSHGLIPAYFSSTDMKVIRNEYVCNWMISMVGNTRRDYKARLDIFEPIPISVALPILVMMPDLSEDDQERFAELLKESMGSCRTKIKEEKGKE